MAIASRSTQGGRMLQIRANLIGLYRTIYRWMKGLIGQPQVHKVMDRPVPASGELR